MTAINNNLNTSFVAQIALWAANVIDWLSENLAALCSRVSSLLWKGESVTAPSLQGRVNVVVLTLSQMKIKEIIEILRAAQKDHGKLWQFHIALNQLPQPIQELYATKYRELIKAVELTGLERTTSGNIAAALIAFDEIAQGI